MTPLLLPLAAFLSAAASLSVEITIVRLGAPYVGQSLLPWSAAIASVLTGLTVGHLLGGLVGGASAGIVRLRVWLGGIWLAASFATFALPALAGVVAAALADDSGFGLAAIVGITALACPPSVAAGFVAPLAVRIAVLMPGVKIPRMVGAIYAASAVGSVVGTVAAGFYFLESVGASGLARIVALGWMMLGAAALPWRALSPASIAAALGLMGTTPLLAVAAPANGPCLIESRYTCIRLLDRPLADGGLLRFMILDEGVHSASDRDAPERLHLGYAGVADRLARSAFAGSSDPRALVIGGGGATLPRAWASAALAADVTVAELDGRVAVLAADVMWATGRSNLKTIVGDGRAVLRSLPSSEFYDVVLMDAYRTRSVPPHLVTREFAVQVAARLSGDGVYLSNIIDRAEPPLLALSIARTLASVFPTVDIWIAGNDAGGTTNVVVAAWKNADHAHRPKSLDIAATVMDAGEAARTQNVVWTRLDFRLSQRRWPQACAVVLNDDWAPVDRLLAGRHICRHRAADGGGQ